MDLYDIVRDDIIGECGNLSENLKVLGLDVVGAVTPGATGVGKAYKGVTKTVKTRPRPGRDGGISEMIIERIDGMFHP